MEEIKTKEAIVRAATALFLPVVWYAVTHVKSREVISMYAEKKRAVTFQKDCAGEGWEVLEVTL